MNNKFQKIIATSAIVVPAMSTEEIRITLLEASLEYVKKNIDLDTLVLLALKMQYFMGMRGTDSTKIENMLSKIINFTPKQKAALFIDSMLLESVDQSLVKAH